MDNAIHCSPEVPPRNLVVSPTLPENSTPHEDPATPSPAQVPASQSTDGNMDTAFVQPYQQFHSQPALVHLTYVPVDPSGVPRSQSWDVQAARGTFNMAGMQRALPVPIYPQGQQPPIPQQQQMGLPASRIPSSQQRFPTGPSTAAVAFQLSQQIHQYQGGLGGLASPTDQSGQFYTHPQYQHNSIVVDSYGRSYAAPADAAQSVASVVPYSSSYPPQSRHAMVPVQGHMGQQWYPFQQQPVFYPQPGYPATFHALPVHPYMDPPIETQSARRHSVPIKQPGVHQIADPVNMGSGNVPYGPSGSRTGAAGTGMNPYGSGQQSQAGSRTSLPRGPPRKPKRTGNALWVGNLPMNTGIAHLKDFFSRGYKHDIESIKLMRSNSAFINYKTEAAMNDALNKFHDFRFQGTRLVVRISRESGPTTSTAQPRTSVRSPVVSGPASAHASGDEDRTTPPTVGREQGESTATTLSPPSGPSGGARARTVSKERYFIIKSVSVEDVEMSVKTGVWATQSHNEEVFNQAYETAENVYLFFSVNRKGEYYGYARMASRIDEEAASSISRLAPSTPDVDIDQEEGVITPETETAPRGRIIDDRDNLFWETLSTEEPSTQGEKTSDEEEDGGQTADGKRLLLGDGKPFKVEWISTLRVPFLKVRGLRNPWNSNREVKIARDGTEVEPVVGRRLVQLFHGPAHRTVGFSVVPPQPLPQMPSAAPVPVAGQDQ